MAGVELRDACTAVVLAAEIAKLWGAAARAIGGLEPGDHKLACWGCGHASSSTHITLHLTFLTFGVVARRQGASSDASNRSTD